LAKTAQSKLKYPPEINLARRVIARFHLTVPVDVVSLAKKYANVSMETLPIDADGVCYDLKRSGVRPKIVLNRMRPSTRLRFTAAHELGHVLIPWHTGIMVDDTSSSNSGVIQHYEMEDEANRFASEILIPSNWLLSEIEHWLNPIDLVAHVASVAEVSPAAAVIKVSSLLEPGYLYAQLAEDDVIIVSGRSPGTIASGLQWGVPVDTEARFSVCEERWTGKIGGARYCWWKLPNRVAVPVTQDKREWRQILDDILIDLTNAGPARQHARQSINGVFGAANGRSSTQSNEELYASLLQTFEVRRQQSLFYEHLTQHPKFSDFLSQRIAAIKR
jgi:hypothetical protein